ncbi:MAG: YfiR family protein [Bacteroidetes bacterium]|nr:YfiR family protein [Bacteroidota bacterium]MBS1541444.1 YfiR family protein [Bacteroidota bacterium]
MIYNFMKYIQWPPDEETEFVVGVLGEDQVFNILKNYEGKPRGAKKYVIKKLASPSEAATCSVVYIGRNKSKDFDNVRSSINGKSVLTITDSSNLGAKGSCINFKVVDERLKFEINQSSINNNNLKVASQLTTMAILI